MPSQLSVEEVPRETDPEDEEVALLRHFVVPRLVVPQYAVGEVGHLMVSMLCTVEGRLSKDEMVPGQEAAGVAVAVRPKLRTRLAGALG